MTGVRLDYPGRPGVLRGADLVVAPGEVVVVAGRSGSGKSSLLNIAAGLETATAGEVTVMGEAVAAARPQEAAALRARHVGLVFQHLHLLPELNVAENVLLPLHLARVPRKEAVATVKALLLRFGLARFATRSPERLSGGEQQRVAIARALATRPALLLVDEPTSSLDAQNARSVRDALVEAARGGAGVLVVTHDEVLHAAGRLLRLEDGVLRGPS